MKPVRALQAVIAIAYLTGAIGNSGSIPSTRAAEKHAPDPKRFLIVAPQKFHPALADYLDYKRTLRPTDLVSLEHVLQSTQGVDDPERLKRFLYDAWRNRQLGYVLLVGDVDVMPVRYMVLDRKTPAAFDYAFYPSDLYYGDLAKSGREFDDWNAMKQGFHAQYFGEVRGETNKNDPINYDRIDYWPEIAFGRWPVSTEREVQIVAAKSLAYETSIRNGTHPGLRRVAFFNTAGYVDARGRMSGWSHQLPRGWQWKEYFYTDRNKKFRTPPPDERNAIAAMNRGQALIVHVGHGNETAWHNSLTSRGLSQLKDADGLPVVVSAGCSTACFAPLPPYGAYVDVHGKAHAGTNEGEVFHAPPPPAAPFQTGKYNPTGLGEMLLKQERTGAVVYIGCNTGAQPCGITLAEGFVAALNESPQPLVGDCWVNAIRYYHDKERLATLKPNDDWYPPSIFFQGMKFMFFGDPTLPFAASVPRQASQR